MLITSSPLSTTVSRSPRSVISKVFHAPISWSAFRFGVLKPADAEFFGDRAYAALYDQAIRQGWRLPDRWSGYSQHSVDALPLPTHHLSAAEVLRFRDDAFQKYFSAPSYLEMIRRRFGDATVAHIAQMASHRLDRANAGATTPPSAPGTR